MQLENGGFLQRTHLGGNEGPKSEIQKRRYVKKMAKQIKEVYDRDHSEISDFHSINSFDSLSESCLSR